MHDSLSAQVRRQQSFLERPALQLLRLDWEKTLYLALIILAIVTRFWGLGWRAMSHDESLHVVFSHKLYAGEGYQHDPMMHGPFLFHANALIYFLFGPSDFTGRIVPALFGVALVASPWFMRRWLGRAGALAASLMFLLSPTISYYARYIRNESYMLLFYALVIILIFRYLETRNTKLLYGLALVTASMFATKEVAFIFVLIVGLFLFIVSLAEWRRKPIFPPAKTPLLDLVVVLGTLTLPLASAAIVSLFGFNPLDYSAQGILRSGLVFLFLQVIAAGIGLWWDRKRWPLIAVVYYIPFILLYTTFFTNGKGFATGILGSLGYWIEQHEVQRGGQPWFYYGFLLPLYEFLPLLLGLAAVVVYSIRRGRGKEEPTEEDPGFVHASGLFMPFMIYLTLASLLAYSYAGEKMPWLTVHMAMPLVILAGWLVNRILQTYDWGDAWRRGALILGPAVLLFVFALSQLISLRPFRGREIAQLSETMGWLAGLLIGAGLVAVIVYYGQRLGGRLAGQTLFATACVILALFTTRAMWMANFVNYDYATEHLVYAHATPDIKIAVGDLDKLSRRLSGDRSIRFAYDDGATWPLEWYFRDFTNGTYYGAQPTREALDVPVVFAGDRNWDKVRPLLGNRYYQFTYKLIWWPLEDYKGLTWSRLFQQLTSPAELRKLWDVFCFRKFDHTPANWPLRTEFAMFVRKDMANQVWDFGAFPPEAYELPVDIYLEGMRDVPAVATFGMRGEGPGQLMDPRNVAIGPGGEIFVLDSGNHRVQVLDAEGRYLREWGEQGSGALQLNDPWGIVVAEDGTVYVADTWNHRVVRYTSTGDILGVWGYYGATEGLLGQEGVFWGPRALALDPDGNLYVTDTGNKRIQKFTPDGTFLGQWGGVGFDAGQFDEPVGVAIDRQGNIYVADTWNRRVQKFDTQYKLITQWEILTWEGQSVLNKPYLAVGSDERLYISDPEGYRILVYELDGTFVATFGTYGQDARSFSLPSGVAADDDGYIYVADTGNARVMKFAVLP